MNNPHKSAPYYTDDVQLLYRHNGRQHNASGPATIAAFPIKVRVYIIYGFDIFGDPWALEA